jgi:hypothetical protein
MFTESGLPQIGPDSIIALRIFRETLRRQPPVRAMAHKNRQGKSLCINSSGLTPDLYSLKICATQYHRVAAGLRSCKKPQAS